MRPNDVRRPSKIIVMHARPRTVTHEGRAARPHGHHGQRHAPTSNRVNGNRTSPRGRRASARRQCTRRCADSNNTRTLSSRLDRAPVANGFAKVVRTKGTPLVSA